MNKDLISQSEISRLKNFGGKVSVYRQCANLPTEIFASRIHVSASELEAIEKGFNNNVNTALALRISQELGVSYADLFEADNEKYFANFHDEIAMKYIIHKCKEYGFMKISNKLDIKRNNLTNWQARDYIPSPFVLGNIMTFLKITPMDLEGLIPKKIEKSEEVVEEIIKEPEKDMMSQVIEACNLYKNIEAMRAELDEIIAKAQELRKMLGGE